VRNESTSATQALSLLNNAFTLMVAEEWSERVEGELKATDSSSDQELERAVRRMFVEALAREPTEVEAAHLVALSQQHGLVVVARVLFNLNEFFYVD
jgi:cytochrome c-type biogenesis protein CcmH/NrfG